MPIIYLVLCFCHNHTCQYVIQIQPSLFVVFVEEKQHYDVDENEYDNIKYLQAKEITRLKGKFATMVANVQDIIYNQQCDIQQMILKLCVADEKNLTVFSTDEAFTKITTTIKMFHHIGQYISIYDYDLLSAFVVSSECEEAVQVLENFTVDLHESVLKDLNLMTDCGELLQPEWFPSGACKLVIKYIGGNCTIKVKRIVQNIIRERFRLMKGSIIFKGVEEGCVALVYEASAAVKSYLLQYSLDDDDLTVLAQHKIKCLMIDDVILPCCGKVCCLNIK